jgi:sugar phosphate permease
MKTKELSESRKNVSYVLFIIASFFLYIILTGSKNLYVAEKTTLNTLGFGSLTELALTMEYYFYAYALTQVVLIFFIKKINVKWFLTVTVSASALLTVYVAFSQSLVEHYVIYIANGFLQAGIWSCLFKLFGEYLPMRFLPFANKLMASGPAVAGIISYGFAAAFGDEWRTPFATLGVILLLAVVAYFVTESRVYRIQKGEAKQRLSSTNEVTADEEDNDFIHLDSKVRVFVFYVVSSVMSFLVTSLFFMLNNNIDVFFKEIGGFSNDVSKLLTILVPITIVVGPMLTVSSCEKHKNFILVGAVYFGISAFLSLLILFFYNSGILFSLLLLLLFLVVCNGARMITMSIIALKMRRKINTGVLSAALNAAASLASGIAPRVVASILDNESLSAIESWQNAFLLIFILNLVIVVSILLIELWVYLINRKKPENATPALAK